MARTYDSAYESEAEGDFEDLEAEDLETSKTMEVMEVDNETNAEDEEDWGGVSDPKSQPVEVQAMRRSHLPPSREELRTILDATTLFRDSAFKLKIDALLPSVRPKESRRAPLEDFLMHLHGVLSNLPSVESIHPLRAAEKLSSLSFDLDYPPSTPVTVPYSQPWPTEATNWKVAFEKPSEITLVGSWPTHTSVRGQDSTPFAVDLAVEMPSLLFQDKDYLNGRFFQKRSFYLAYLAYALVNSPTISEHVLVNYFSPTRECRNYRVVLSPRPTGARYDFTKLKAHIHIIPMIAPDNPMSLARTSPHQSNIRTGTANDTIQRTYPSSPLYNNALLLSFTPRQRLLSTHDTSKTSPAFVDAVTLLRVWANQRGYGFSANSSTCIVGFENLGPWWATLVELLIFGEEASFHSGSEKRIRKALGTGLSSYQLFRAVIDFLAHHNFRIAIATKVKRVVQFRTDDFISDGSVFVDAQTSHNMLAGVPMISLEMLGHDSQATLEMLNTHSENQDVFRDVFLEDHRTLATRYDVLLTVELSQVHVDASPHAMLEAGSARNMFVTRLCDVLGRGLGDRCRAIAVMVPSSSSYTVQQGIPDTYPTQVQVGLILNLEHAYRLVDHGPAATEVENDEVNHFRQLWGDKAELRRFKDGRITESVVWDAPTVDDRLRIPVMIVEHLLAHHFRIPTSACTTWQSGFDAAIRLPPTISSIINKAGLQGGFRPASVAYQDFVKLLKDLDDELPLGILGISSASPALRQTSVFAPIPVSSSAAASLPLHARHLPTLDINIQFEKAGQWPDDLHAIQKVKMAFLEQIGTALQAKVPGMSVELLVDSNVPAIVDQVALQVVTPAGWAFKARIYHDREFLLLNRIIDDRSHVVKRNTAQQNIEPGQLKRRRQTQQALAVHERRFVHAPAHHRAVAHLSSLYPAYAGAVRLLKRWLSSHWLLGYHVSEEAAELLASGVFVQSPGAQQIPHTRERGFALIMFMLRDWSWNEGMDIPLYELEDPKATPRISSTSTSASLHSAWRLSTSVDREGRMWTSSGPDVVIARRVQALATATCNLLLRSEPHQLIVKNVFAHPTEDYDVLIELNPKVLPRYGQNVGTPSIKSTHTPIESMPYIDFDPAQLFCHDIQSVYHDTFKVFHDQCGGDRVGLVWDPSIRQPKPFRVMNQFSGKPIADPKSHVTLNESAVLAEVARMGEGLITKITTQS